MLNTNTLEHFTSIKAAFQQVIMDKRGFILESTDTIFSTFHHRHRPVMEWSPFLESIFPLLQTLKFDSPEIYFPLIQSITCNNTGLYDCFFICIQWCDNQEAIVWHILNKTADIEKITEAQQVSNEIHLLFERLETGK